MIWDDSSANFCYKCMTCIFSKTMRLPDELHEKSSYNKSNGTSFGKGVYRRLCYLRGPHRLYLPQKNLMIIRFVLIIGS